MTLRVVDPELLAVTADGFSLSFAVADASGPVDASARVLVNSVPRAVSEGTAGTRLVRIEGLAPDTEYEISLAADGREIEPRRQVVLRHADGL